MSKSCTWFVAFILFTTITGGRAFLIVSSWSSNTREEPSRIVKSNEARSSKTIAILTFSLPLSPLSISSLKSSSALSLSKLRERKVFKDWFTPETTSEQQQRIRDEYEQLEDADFLMLDVAPKALVHERDYFRQETRIQAWDEYVLVSILCTSISFGALLNFQLIPSHQGIVLYETLKIGIQVFSGLAVLTGLYSTMVFSLSILYARTALGMERDPQYDTFLDNTEAIRKKAFRAFSLSLFSFSILVVLMLTEHLPLFMHLPLGSLMIMALFVGVRDWMVLVKEASGIFAFSDTDNDDTDDTDTNA
jgi:hypothetical protein